MGEKVKVIDNPLSFQLHSSFAWRLPTKGPHADLVPLLWAPFSFSNWYLTMEWSHVASAYTVCYSSYLRRLTSKWKQFIYAVSMFQRDAWGSTIARISLISIHISTIDCSDKLRNEKSNQNNSMMVSMTEYKFWCC